MTLGNISKIALLPLAICLVFALAGCAQQQMEEATEQQPKTPSQYMAEVNRSVDILKGDLQTFSEAVESQDISGMRAKAEIAFSDIDDLSNIEAPEELADLKTKYVEGAQDLKTALDEYLALYIEIEDATKANPFDFSSYGDKLTAIQNTYNNGLTKLEEADQQATEM